MGSESAGPTSANEDGEARYHLDRLRDGTQREKIAARMSLARIFERRGMLDEVVELYERNILDGARGGVLYERLAAVYRRQGRIELARATLRRRRELCPSNAARSTPGGEADGRVPRRPAAVRHRARTRRPAAGWAVVLGFAVLFTLPAGPAVESDRAPVPGLHRAEETGHARAVSPDGFDAPPVEVARDGMMAERAVWHELLDQQGVRTDAPSAAAAEHDVLADSPEPADPDPGAVRSDSIAEPGVFVVADVGGAGLSLRHSPGAGERVQVWPEGTEVVGLGERVAAAGRTWMKVRDPAGGEGWAATEFLVARTAEAAPIRMLGRASTADLPESRSLTPNQLTDGATLTTGEALAACAPAAAVAFARASGLDPTLDEAVDLARRVGWTAWDGMAGPRSQVDLLARMGIAARLEHADGGIDWGRVVGDVRDGKPVIVAAAGHYFVAEGYDPASGRFDFGNSAAVLRAARGKRWFAPHELGSLGMGAPLSTIHLAASAPSLGRADLGAAGGAVR